MFAFVKGSMIVVTISYLFYQSVLALLLLSPLALFYFKGWKKMRISKRQQEFQVEFKEALQSLITAMNVGYSVENAIREAAKEMERLYGEEALITREFFYMVRQLEMNITVEQVLMEFSGRVGLEDVDSFSTAFVTIRRSGGDMIAVLKNTVDKICSRIEVKQEIRTMVAAKNMEFRLMSVIPLGIIIYMKLAFSEFVSVLYGNLLGVVIMSICLGMYMGAFYLGKTMLEIEV